MSSAGKATTKQPLNRAMLACKNSGYEVLDHFAEVRKMVDTGNICILTIYVLVYNCPSEWVGSNFYLNFK